MDYQLKINQENGSPGSGKTRLKIILRFTIGDSTHDVHYAMVHDHQIHLTMNGQRVNAYVSDQDDGKIIVIRGKNLFCSGCGCSGTERIQKKRDWLLIQQRLRRPCRPW